MSLFASVLVLLLVGLYAADALPSGAPLGACANVAPDPTSAHGSTVQTDPPPYELDLSVFDANGTYQYNPGMTYTLTFERVGAMVTFRGFFVRTAMAADASFVTDATFATISGQNYTRLSQCTPATSGITHSNTDRDDLTQVQFSWTAPPEGTGPILFRYAVVQTLNIYWADQRSDILAEVGGGASGLAGSLLCLLLSLVPLLQL